MSPELTPPSQEVEDEAMRRLAERAAQLALERESIVESMPWGD